MKIAKLLTTAVLCGVFAFSAFAGQTTAPTQPVQLAYNHHEAVEHHHHVKHCGHHHKHCHKVCHHHKCHWVHH